MAAGAFDDYPTYPAGWNNLVGEIDSKPLRFNLSSPTAPNLAPLPISNLEALLRFGGTNSPAVTSEIMRRMPKTFSDSRARNMVTRRRA